VRSALGTMTIVSTAAVVLLLGILPQFLVDRILGALP
jgi:hypothetical protein